MIPALPSYPARLVSFLCAVGLYACFGLPTPNNPGLIEGLIGLLLIASVGWSGAYAAIRVDPGAPIWRGTGQILCVFGLSLPLLNALLHGHDPALILRDLIPFLFMLLPLFLTRLITASPTFFRATLFTIIAAGLLFALRASAEHVQAIAAYLFISPPRAELTYLANAPTILCAGIFIFGTGACRYLRAPSVKTLAVFILCACLAALAFAPLAFTIQRASLAYAALALTLLGAAGLYYYPWRSLSLAALLALLLLPVSMLLSGIVELGLQKTALVGLNMRFEEAQAVWAEISSSPLTLLFGKGWGAGFASPAVGGVYVQYTHGLLTSALLKTGLIGVSLAAAYIAALMLHLVRHIRTHYILVLALAGPVLIDSFLYASFKSLDFGLVLLLAATIPPRAEEYPKSRVAKNRQLRYLLKH